MVKRKRRSGGGRKPRGPIPNKTENFSTRISPDTRAALELEARRTGQSISQAAEVLLRIGLEERKGEQSNRPLRALFFLIEQLAEATASSGAYFGGTKNTGENAQFEKNSWRTDRYKFEAFKAAVVQLLSFLTPNAPMHSPWEKNAEKYARMYAQFDTKEVLDQLKDDYSTPTKFGSRLFSSLLNKIHGGDEFHIGNPTIMQVRPELDEIVHEQRYGVADARRDLDLLSNDGWRQK